MSDNISNKISTLLGTNDVSSIPDLTPDIDISDIVTKKARILWRDEGF